MRSFENPLLPTLAPSGRTHLVGASQGAPNGSCGALRATPRCQTLYRLNPPPPPPSPPMLSSLKAGYIVQAAGMRRPISPMYGTQNGHVDVTLRRSCSALGPYCGVRCSLNLPLVAKLLRPWLTNQAARVPSLYSMAAQILNACRPRSRTEPAALPKALS